MKIVLSVVDSSVDGIDSMRELIEIGLTEL